MAVCDKKVEEQLLEAGNKLLETTSDGSVDELLALLERVEDCLLRVDQSPSESTKNALAPSLKALVSKDLLKHSDDDVKAAVASCISEITRITAPEAPYEDEQMKDIFELIVSTFERLADKSSRSYEKRISILETVAKVRSCVVMLDLECDTLILEMFKHILKAIRDYHPDIVVSSMETILTLVLEESEDISPELLSPILATVKKDNEEVLPVARRLVEKVLENCATKLRPYMLIVLKSLNRSSGDYSEVVARICQETSGAIERNATNASAEHAVHESKLEGALSEEAAQARDCLHKETTAEEASLGECHPLADDSAKSVLSNGVKEAAVSNAVVDSNAINRPEVASNTSNRPERRVVIKLSEKTIKVSQAEPDNLDAGKLCISESKSEKKPEQTTKKRGRKSSSSKNAAEPKLFEQDPIDGEKQSDPLTDSGKSICNETKSSQLDLSVEAAVPPENKDEIAIQLSSPKALESDTVKVVSPSNNESSLRKAGRPKKKRSLVQQATPSADVASTEISDRAIDLEIKADKQTAKKVEASKDGEKRERRRKSKLEKDEEESSAKDEKESISSRRSAAKSAKHKDPLEETSIPSVKRKRTPAREITSGSTEYGEDLVGSRLKVWWPKDKAFYEGVIESFDPIRKKHKVLYNDGDIEILNLNKQRWELIKSNSISDEGVGTGGTGDASSMHKKKKAKLNSGSSTKQRKVEAAPIRDGGSSSKTKVSAMKTGRGSKDDSKVDGKSKADGSKTAGNSETKKAGKQIDAAAKTSGKNVDPDTPKNNSQSEQDISKTAARVGGKSSKSGGKLKPNGTGELKSGSSKKEKSLDSAVEPESTKRRLLDSSKGKHSEGKSGKKRRKEVSN